VARVHHGHEEWCAYHLTTRALDAKFLLAEPQDKHRILAAISFDRCRRDIELYGFVVMNNHVHLVLRPLDRLRLYEFANRFKTWTSRNSSVKICGKLWERRYDDNRIKSRSEMRSVLEYVHLNPVRAGMVSRPEDYCWSSIHSYLGTGRHLIEIDTEW
jgi:putative transposase